MAKASNVAVPTYRVTVKRKDAFVDRFSGIEFENGSALVSDPVEVKYCFAQGWEMQRIPEEAPATPAKGSGDKALNTPGNAPVGSITGQTPSGTNNQPPTSPVAPQAPTTGTKPAKPAKTSPPVKGGSGPK